MSKKHYVLSSYHEGESMTVYTTITEEQIKAIEGIVGSDFFDDLTKEHPVQIKEITLSEHVDSLLNGEAIGNGFYHKNEQIKSLLVSGLESEELEDIKTRYPDDYATALKFDDIEKLQEHNDSLEEASN